MNRPILSLFLVMVGLVMQAGCRGAQYAKIRVQVIDAETGQGISKAQVRTSYIKPMFDLSYQRKDCQKTDSRGFATLTIATNWSQKTMFGWTHGIRPHFSIETPGYRIKQVGSPVENPSRIDLLLFEMQRTNNVD